MSGETATLPQQSQQPSSSLLQGPGQVQPNSGLNPTNFPLPSVPLSLPLQLPINSQLVGNPAAGLPYQNASLYVGDLHPDVTDSTLYDIFNAVGPVASIRVCRDALSRKSLGYAYVNFHSAKDAERALDTMNYTLIKDRPCRIMWSQRDPSLRKTGQGNVFVKHLDLSIDNKALYDTFSLFGNILSCKVVTDSQGKSRGYGFVHFETTEAADEAIKKINGMLIAGKEVFVGRFLKKHDRPTAKDFTNVYVKNLPKQWTKSDLEEFFSVCGPIASSIIMTAAGNNNNNEDKETKSKGFGFIDFAEHEGAENAISKFDKFELIVDDLRDKSSKDIKKPATDNKAGSLSENSNNIEQNTESQENETDQNDNFDEKSTSTVYELLPDGKVKLTLSVCRAQKKSERERELSQKFHELKVERQNKYDGVNLYVKNLDDRVDDELLRKEFEPFGNITSARVMREKLPISAFDNDTEKEDKDGQILTPSKGFGFVCYSLPEEAVKAVTEMNGKMWFGKPLFVALAQRKEQRRIQLESQNRQQRLINLNTLGNMSSVPVPVSVGNMQNMNMGNIGLNNMGLNSMGNMGPIMNNMLLMQNLAAQRGFNANNMNQTNANSFDKPPRNVSNPASQNINPRAQVQTPNQFPRSTGPRNFNPNFGQNMGQGQSQNQQNFMQNRSNVQFTQNARNTAFPRPRNFSQNMNLPLPMNMPMSQQGQTTHGQSSVLNSQVLMSASPEERKTLIGEQLYPLVHRLEPGHSAKITGMLLEMENAELLHLIESPESLMGKVREAVEILRHAQNTE